MWNAAKTGIEGGETTFAFHTERTRGQIRFEPVNDSASYSKPRGNPSAFPHFDTIPECDRQKDGQTDGRICHSVSACKTRFVARCKNTTNLSFLAGIGLLAEKPYFKQFCLDIPVALCICLQFSRVCLRRETGWTLF